MLLQRLDIQPFPKIIPCECPWVCKGIISNYESLRCATRGKQQPQSPLNLWLKSYKPKACRNRILIWWNSSKAKMESKDKSCPDLSSFLSSSWSCCLWFGVLSCKSLLCCSQEMQVFSLLFCSVFSRPRWDTHISWEAFRSSLLPSRCNQHWHWWPWLDGYFRYGLLWYRLLALPAISAASKLP